MCPPTFTKAPSQVQKSGVACCCRPVYSSSTFYRFPGCGLHVKHLDEPNTKPNHPFPSPEWTRELQRNRFGTPDLVLSHPPSLGAHASRRTLGIVRFIRIFSLSSNRASGRRSLFGYFVQRKPAPNSENARELTCHCGHLCLVMSIPEFKSMNCQHHSRNQGRQNGP